MSRFVPESWHEDCGGEVWWVMDTAGKHPEEYCRCDPSNIAFICAALNAADAREKAAGFDLKPK